MALSQRGQPATSSKGRQRRLWSDESMAEAVKKVHDKENGLGLREAYRRYCVPIETLRRRVAGSVTLDCKTGPPTILTPEEESKLEQYVVEKCDMGFGLTREDVVRTAYAIVDQSGRKYPFRNGMAGRSWFDGFRSHHPKLSPRIAQPFRTVEQLFPTKKHFGLLC